MRQQTSYSCGAACLAALCQHFQVKPDTEAELAALLGTDPDDGTRLLEVRAVAEALGLRVTEFAGDADLLQLAQQTGAGNPVLCPVQMYEGTAEYGAAELAQQKGHYVVALAVTATDVVVEDPATEARVPVPRTTFVQRWHDVDADGRAYRQHGLAFLGVRAARVASASKVFCPTGPGGGVDPSCSPGAASVEVTVGEGDGEKLAALGIATPSDIAPVVGAQPGAKVEVVRFRGEGDRTAAVVRVHHEKYFASRLVYKDHIENDSIEVFDKGSGLGTKIFADQVREAAAKGYDRIEAFCIRGSVSNGYYTWARLGYDGAIPEEVAGAVREAFPGAARVSDLMKTSEGRSWWKEHGASFEGVFDLKKGSLSREVFDAYQKERARRKAARAVPGGGGGPGQGVGRGRVKDDPCRDEQGRFTSCGGSGEGDASGGESAAGTVESKEQAESLLARVGSLSWEALKGAGAKASEVEHAAKEYVTHKVGERLAKLPVKVRAMVEGVWKAVRLGTAAAFSTYRAGQSFAEQVSLAKGATPEQAARLRAALSATDVAAAKPVTLGLTAVGLGAAALPASFVPVGSLTYLAYSTARDPLATARAAGAVVQAAARRLGLTKSAEHFQVAASLHDVLAEFAEGDFGLAVYLEALDQTGAVAPALAVTRDVARREADLTKSGAADPCRDEEGRFATCGGAGDSAADEAGGGATTAQQDAWEQEDDVRAEQRDQEDATRDAAREEEDGRLQDEEDAEEAALAQTAARADAARDAARDKEDQRLEKEEERLQRARDKEDAHSVAARDREDAQIERRRDKEDTQTERERTREDARSERERDKEDAAREAARDQEDQEIDAARERELAAVERQRETGELDEEQADERVMVLEAEHYAADADRIAQRDREDEEIAASRAAADEARSAAREDEDAARSAACDQEDEARSHAREEADEQQQQQRDQEDEAREQAAAAREAAREAEDAAIEATRAQEYQERVEQRERQEAARQAAREAEDAALAAARAQRRQELRP